MQNLDSELLQKNEIPKKPILIYDDNKSVVELLKSVDKITKEEDW